jgi:xylan 1,4-beta-xylosidase
MMKQIRHFGGWLALTTSFCGIVRAEGPPAQVRVAFTEKLGPMHMDRMALGQGGLSEEPMLANRVTELRALKPGIIRLFVQEYYNLLPERGRYHFDTLDRMVDSILKTGAKPLMCLCFKPRVLFPEINDAIVEPNVNGGPKSQRLGG